MVATNGQPQSTIIDILKNKSRTLSAEIIPPRNGTETDLVLRQIERLKEVPVDFISVTKGAGGSLRGGTLPIAQMIKHRFDICSLAHFTCRDYTIEEIENNLMDHHYFGVSNILALRGDPPDGKPDHFQPAANRHSYAWQLAQQISRLNLGEYIVREGFDKKHKDGKRQGARTNFCIGVAAHPEQEPHENAVEYLKRKVDCGAKFAITQMLFSSVPYERFIESCAKAGINIPIIPGVRIITQATTAVRMMQKRDIFGVTVPQHFIDRLALSRDKDEGIAIGLDHTRKICEEMIRAGAPGIHAFVMNDEKTAAELLISLK